MELNFRPVRADEIECRVGAVGKTSNGFSLLLYKDARTDMNILDETVGAMNWKKSYALIDGQLFCTIEIWDDEKKQWIGKQDVGIESNTEAEKGRASDAQKRSGFAWGIGRELYTAPFIWITDGDPKRDKFVVDTITIVEKKITSLTIKNAKTGDIVYTFGKPTAKKATATKKAEPKKAEPKKAETKVAEAPETDMPMKARFGALLTTLGFTKEEKIQMCQMYKLTSNSNDDEFTEAVNNIEAEFAERLKELEGGVV